MPRVTVGDTLSELSLLIVVGEAALWEIEVRVDINYAGGRNYHNTLKGQRSNQEGLPAKSYQDAYWGGQWLTNPTSIYEDVGLIPGLAQWVRDPVLP